MPESSLHYVWMLAFVFSVCLGILFGKFFIWMKKNSKEHHQMQQDIADLHIRLIVTETQLNERRRPDSFGPNNFIIPEPPKKKAGRPPKKVEMKNP